MTSTRNLKAFLLLILAAGATACGDDATTCGAGTVERDGRCIPVIGPCFGAVDANGNCVLPCETGQAWDPVTARCVAALDCSPGTVAEAGVCVPACSTAEHWNGTACVTGPACAPGTVLNDTGDGCVPGPDSCGPGTHLENDS